VCAVPAAGEVAAHAQSVHASAGFLRSAERAPHRMFRVIVQKRGVTQAPEALIRTSGGRVTRDLSLINAVAATVPGRALDTLARTNSVNWLSPDAAVRQQRGPDGSVNTWNLVNTYDRSIGADQVWAQRYQGANVNIAVVDSGVASTGDLGGTRILAATSVNAGDSTTTDGYGHGSHVAGIIASNGSASSGKYIGIAPKAGIISVKVFNNLGQGTVSDVIAGLQWIYNNRFTYNIRIVNLSLDTTLAQSYHVDPLDAACEMLWFNKILVVVAAGNNQQSAPGTIYSPANDPFVLTVGAVDDAGTPTTSDDTLAPYSAYGTTLDGFSKPDVVAPGADIISTLASSSDYLALAHPSHIDAGFFDMSGTSMAAAVVSGAAALLLETNPSLTPDQIKSRLMSTAAALSPSSGTGAGEVNVYAATQSWSTASANTGVAVCQGLVATASGIGPTWDSASWGSASWGSASWGSASWGSASWGSASWGSASWGSASWGSDYWGKTRKHPHITDDDKTKHG
jgi:serine protease AprX